MFPSGASGVACCLAQNLDLVSLHALLALDGFEGNLLAFLQAAETAAFDSTEVHEQIRTAFGGDEAEALLIVEPFDGAGLTIRHVFISLKLEWMAVPVTTGIWNWLQEIREVERDEANRQDLPHQVTIQQRPMQTVRALYGSSGQMPTPRSAPFDDGRNAPGKKLQLGRRGGRI